MFRNKKGAITPTPGTDIAALVLLIALFMIVYVLLLPPADRQDLLESNPNYNNGGTSGDYNDSYYQGISLLSASPGKLYPFERNTITKDFPPAILFTRTESDTINLASQIEVKRSPFSEQTRTYTFAADDLNDIINAKLFFFIQEGDGTFYVELNGQTIFEQELGTSDIPITLPVNALRANNNLKIGVKGIFWEGYILKDVNIKFDKNYENTIVKRTFDLSASERNGAENVKLGYYLNCIKLGENGFLTILLNGRILTSDYVVCDIGKKTIDLPIEKLRTGENTIEFGIDQGDYELNDLTLELKVGKATYPTYNFELNDDYYFDINTDCYSTCRDDCYDYCSSDDCFSACLNDCDAECTRGGVYLEMRFVNDDDNNRKKRGAITINEQQINFNTDKTLYTRDITNAIRRGDNIIKIVPQSNMEIGSLRIVFVR